MQKTTGEATDVAWAEMDLPEQLAYTWKSRGGWRLAAVGGGQWRPWSASRVQQAPRWLWQPLDAKGRRSFEPYAQTQRKKLR
jgi:hypothetical protein